MLHAMVLEFHSFGSRVKIVEWPFVRFYKINFRNCQETTLGRVYMVLMF